MSTYIDAGLRLCQGVALLAGLSGAAGCVDGCIRNSDCGKRGQVCQVGQCVDVDMGQLDLRQPDLSQPDLSQPDLYQQDLYQPDLSQPDLR